MTTRNPTLVIRHLRNLAGGRGEEVPDGELLDRFAGGDQEAFAELVRRHGPMVFSADSGDLLSRCRLRRFLGFLDQRRE